MYIRYIWVCVCTYTWRNKRVKGKQRETGPLRGVEELNGFRRSC